MSKLRRHYIPVRIDEYVRCLLAAVWVPAVLSGYSLLAQMGGAPIDTSRISVKTATSNSSSATVLTVTGRVVNAATGQPVPRALVQLNGDRVVLADHEGKFEIPQFSAGASWCTLTVTKPGFYGTTEPFAGAPRRIRTEELSNTLEIRMYPEALITGTVTGPDGQPIPHVSVMAQRSTYGMGMPEHTWTTGGQANTNERGTFRITVPPGDYRLQTMYIHNGTGQAVLPVTIPSNSATGKSDTVHLAAGSEQHFDLRPVVGRTYSVSIAMDGTGEGRMPMVLVRSSDGTIIPNGGIRPGGPGEMKMELPSGTYTLLATQRLPGPDRSDSVFYGETGVTVTDHDVTGVTLHMAAVPSIPVVVDVDSAATSDKTPPKAQQLGVMLEAVDTSQSMFGQNMVGVSTSPDGSFHFRANPGTYRLVTRNAGAWYVKAVSYGTADLLTQDLTVAAGSDGGLIRLTVSDQMAAVHGSVTLHGNPADCNVYFVPAAPTHSLFYMTRSGSDGKYNFASLPPGTYRVLAFEQDPPINLRDPHALDALPTHVRTLTVASGDKATLDLDAVAESEVVP